jgi:hypothetical protein
MNKQSSEHLVLIGPNGKQAGHKDHAVIAQQIYCVQLNSSGKGGGITTLLLPRNDRQRKKLEKLLGRGYTVKRVRIRSHCRSKIRDAVTDSLLIILAEKFLSEKSSSPRAMSAIIREFSNWICTKLKDPQARDVRSIVVRSHPDLVERTSADWWRKQIAQRKK